MNFYFCCELDIIFTIISQTGGLCRLVGGCVRDYLIRKLPLDFDIITNLPPLTIINIFRKNNINVRLNGIEYGTVLIVINYCTFEITTLRKDAAYCIGGAKIKFINNWQVDAKRRDFTINAMSITSNGAIYDYFHGQKNLNKKKIIFVGSPAIRIHEDYLRILRYLRLLSYLGFSNVNSEGYAISINNIQLLRFVSKERIKQELIKLLNFKFAKKIIAKIINKNSFKYTGFFSITFNSRHLLNYICFKIYDPLINLSLLYNLSNIIYLNKLAKLQKRLCLTNKEFNEMSNFVFFNKKNLFLNYHHFKYFKVHSKNNYLKFLFIVNNFNRIIEYKKYLYSIFNFTSFIFPVFYKDLQCLSIKYLNINFCIRKITNYWHSNNNQLNKFDTTSYLSFFDT